MPNKQATLRLLDLMETAMEDGLAAVRRDGVHFGNTSFHTDPVQGFRIRQGDQEYRLYNDPQVIGKAARIENRRKEIRAEIERYATGVA